MTDEITTTGGPDPARAQSFGHVAAAYDRYRPGPPSDVIEWMLPGGRSTVVDLGAGTGLMTKDLIGRCDRVIAVDPDDQMRDVCARNLPGVDVLEGRGEAIPLPDSTADAVLASSSWHWMDPDRALREVARVLVPSGTLAAVWTGPDLDGPFIAQARTLLSGASSGESATGAEPRSGDLAEAVLDDENRVEPDLSIPDDSAFAPPEQHVTTWDVPLTADDLIGLLQTFSWIITMPEERREHVVSEARRLLRDGLGIFGDVTVDVQYCCEAWRTSLR